MNITSIREYYNSLMNNLSKKTSGTEGTSKSEAITGVSENSISTKKIGDVLDLGSSEANLSGYLNYNSKGQYNTASLAEVLNEESGEDIIDLLGGYESDSTDLLSQIADLGDTSSYLDTSSLSETDELINNIINQRTAYNEYIISQAIERIKAKISSEEQAFQTKVKNL